MNKLPVVSIAPADTIEDLRLSLVHVLQDLVKKLQIDPTNANSQRIQNVNRGIAPEDAVNLKQLRDEIDKIVIPSTINPDEYLNRDFVISPTTDTTLTASLQDITTLTLYNLGRWLVIGTVDGLVDYRDQELLGYLEVDGVPLAGTTVAFVTTTTPSAVRLASTQTWGITVKATPTVIKLRAKVNAAVSGASKVLYASTKLRAVWLHA